MTAFLYSSGLPPAWSGRNGCKGTDTTEKFLEQFAGNGDLGHLEDRPPGMTDDLRPYLDELELDAPQRPVEHLARQGKAAEEVAEIVRQDEQSEPHLV